MTQLKLPVLLFDLGGVLINFDGYDAMAALLKGRLGEEAIRDKWIKSPAMHAFERGQMEIEDFARAMVAEWEMDLSWQEFLADYKTWATGLYDGADTVLDGLRERHTLACLSNINPPHWENIGGEAMRARFDFAFLSYEIGMCKPVPEVYEHVAKTIGATPGDIWFFDDNDACVEGAKAAGMNSVRTRGLADLKAALKNI